ERDARRTCGEPGRYLFDAGLMRGATRQYPRLVGEWAASVGLDAHKFGARSLRRTRQCSSIGYRRTGNLRAVQLLLGTGASKALFAISVSKSMMRSKLPRRSTSDATRQCAAALLIDPTNRNWRDTTNALHSKADIS